MHKKKFGKLLAALRRERADDGKPWSRARFAEISGIEEDILANIENGRKAILLPSLLTRLADALQLTGGERKEFFLAASGAEEQSLFQRSASPQVVLREMTNLMEGLQLPAFLLDQYFDLIAANSMVLDLYRIPPQSFFDAKADPFTRVNLIRFLFDSAFSAQLAMLGKHRDDFLTEAVTLFRAASLRYRAEPYFKCLYARLSKIEEFRKFNQQAPKSEIFADNSLHISLNHPQFGALHMVSASITAFTSAGELKLVILNPLDKPSAAACVKLAEKGYIIHPIEDWPQKSRLRELCEKASR